MKHALVIVIVGVAADFASKAWALQALVPHEPISILPILSLTLGFNPGVAFGLFPAQSWQGTALMIGLQSLIVAGLVYMLAKSADRISAMAYSLVIAGAVGNIIDRYRDGLVTDFFDLHWQGWHWPAFNVADILICAGVVLIAATSLFGAPAKTERRSV
jgi:signal peptidase II